MTGTRNTKNDKVEDWLILVNLNAGRRQAEKDWPRIEDFFLAYVDPNFERFSSTELG